MKIPNYPEDFYDFKEGVDIDNKTINEWIKKCINKLEEDKECSSYSTSSGNTYVRVFRCSEGLKYEVLVSKSHAKAEIYEKE
ncbi:hypothetical protein M3649_03580 [Ureibacillus chungkukjangi]|uniref:hypothetical protein n=1 Tax=Ureibacillus chungkukjangi TaxID=1202712 RepID=UPI0020413A1B|nr:hypothetical protein [Ureibacillus chungkukjangi]MCM3387211.1 hypothetical protein [Ureibacillus chungkukjangi]